MANKLMFNKDTLERFSYIIKYNVETYLDLYRLLVEYNKPLIINYFRQKDTEPDADSFNFLNAMISESIKVSDLIKIHRDSFSRIDDWELAYFLDEVKISLDTMGNTSKWLRSSKTANSWSEIAIQYQRAIKQEETIEDIMIDELSSPDPQNDWVDLSLRNNLLEEDYDVKGGNNLNISRAVASQPNIFLNSVVDNLVGEKLYGADINKKISFVDSDLDVLSYKDTVLQSINVLIGLKKGDVPEFVDFGVDPRLVVGGNLTLFSNHQILQQYTQVFATDDTLRNFQIVNLRYKNGDLFLDFKVDTFYNLSKSDTINLNS